MARVARFWGVLPWQLRQMTKDERAELHAHYTVDLMIDQYFEIEKAVYYQSLERK